jgi:hypothetical protein
MSEAAPTFNLLRGLPFLLMILILIIILGDIVGAQVRIRSKIKSMSKSESGTGACRLQSLRCRLRAVILRAP